jgi:hypothetical protein
VIDAGRLRLFSILYGLTYVGFFFYGEYCACAMFRYYPVLGRFSTVPLPLQEAGLPINWYSWILGAFVLSAVVTVAVPRKLAARIPTNWTWGIAMAVLVAIMVYERRWFY